MGDIALIRGHLWNGMIYCLEFSSHEFYCSCPLSTESNNVFCQVGGMDCNVICFTLFMCL